MSNERNDTRVVYGAMCVWWDSIHKIGVGFNGLPCCPHCGGLLMELPNEDEFMKAAQQHEDEGHPGYVNFVKWIRGKCYRSLAEALMEYRRLQ